jgi:uncharacterized membrane protein YjgN (DUF898 family)
MERENSYFDGGLFQYIGWSILGVIVTVCTLGICFPWAYTMIYNWEVKHTVINGKRLQFNGSAVQLFGTWVKWLFLTIITVGIYLFWIPIKLKAWKTKHIYFVE